MSEKAPSQEEGLRQFVTFKIQGMDCAEEVAVLRDVLSPLVGDEARLAFDIFHGTMTVSLEETTCDVETLRQAIARTGMAAIPWEPSHTSSHDAADTASLWQRQSRALLCLVSAVLLIAAALLAALTQGNPFGTATAWEQSQGSGLLLWLTRLLYLGSVLSGAWFVIPKAFYAARALRPDMNLLMLVAVIGALAIGEWFEAAAVSCLFALALLLESWSVGRARLAIEALMAYSPTTAHCLMSDQHEPVDMPVAEVPVNTRVLVRPGEKIPLDGIVKKGTTAVNQAPITGEAMPVLKTVGDDVFAGTINGDGAIEFSSTRAARDTTLERIIHLVQEAQARRAPSQQWVEKFARIYTPAMIALAGLIAVVPPLLIGGAWGAWFYNALVLLVIACPCALVISTPVSVVAGLTAAAKHGVLIKGGAYLEAPAHLHAVAFDKTGTLTHGQPTVQQVIPLKDHTASELLAYAAALEAHSAHPLARAILHHAAVHGGTRPAVEQYRILPGRGAEATIGGAPFWIGSHRLVEELGAEDSAFHALATQLEDAGHSLIALGNEAHICGLISVVDSVRQEAAATVQALKRLGMAGVVMLSGDNQRTAQAVAEAIDLDRYYAELLPADKVRIVAELEKQYGPVAMVGDGINDAPAMAAATLGIAMGAMGSEAAIETADIALMTDDLKKLPWLIRHSRRTLTVIKQNIVVALGLKLAFVLLALGGLTTLWMAIAADMGASLLVIGNGLRLLRTRSEPL